MRNRGMYLALALIAVAVTVVVAAPVQGGEDPAFGMWNSIYTYGGPNPVILCKLHSTQESEPDEVPSGCQGATDFDVGGCFSVTGTAHAEHLEDWVPSIEHPEEGDAECDSFET